MEKILKCRVCGETCKRLSKGMCNRCYQREWERESRSKKPKKTGNCWCEKSVAILEALNNKKPGQTQTDIANQFGVSRQWVSAIAKKAEKMQLTVNR